MDYIEVERTLEALKQAAYNARMYDGLDTDKHNEAVSTINIEFERLRELLGY